jgi:hypothetical protein
VRILLKIVYVGTCVWSCRTGPGGNSSGNATVGERLLSTLLTEMDGLELATVLLAC